jgi:hypothetical protein
MKNYDDFPKKTQFLFSNSIITDKTKNVFDHCHRHRNEVYHQNIIKESIINDLAKIYLEACCKVIFEVFSSFCNIYKINPVPDILIKYGIVKNHPWAGYDIFTDQITNVFLNGRVCSPHQFIQTLALDINNRIAKVRSDIDYIDSVTTLTEDCEKEMLKLATFSRRANRLSSKKDLSNALESYRSIDDALIQIELSTEFWVYCVSTDEDLQFELSRDERDEEA